MNNLNNKTPLLPPIAVAINMWRITCIGLAVILADSRETQ